jgi:hypothetical protein
MTGQLVYARIVSNFTCTENHSISGTTTHNQIWLDAGQRKIMMIIYFPVSDK